MSPHLSGFSCSDHQRATWFALRSFTPLLLLFSIGLIAADAQSPPRVTSVTPALDSTGVGTGSEIVIMFDQPLGLTSFPLVTLNGLVGNISVQPEHLVVTAVLSLDRTVLTLKATSSLPSNTLITWTLNPAGGILPLGNAAGQLIETVSGSFTTGSSGIPTPVISSVTPASDAVDVSPSSEIVFNFDQEMDVSVTLQLGTPPIAVGNYQIAPQNISTFYQTAWQEDGRSLRLIPIAALPLGTTVTWRLNPGGTTTPIRSLAGEPLAEISGTFTIASETGGNEIEECDSVGDAPGIFLFTKVFSHHQISADEVSAVGDQQPLLTALAQGPPLGPEVVGGSLTFPNGDADAFEDRFLGYGSSTMMASEAALEAAYPAGDYIFRFTRDGEVERAVPMSVPSTPSTIPMITNFDEAQRIEADTPFVLRWNTFTESGSDGAFVRMTITDEIGNLIFRSPNECVPRDLAPTETSVIVPAGYFKPGFRYRGTLQFGIVFHEEFDAATNMSGFGGVSRFTTFELRANDDGGGGSAAPAMFVGHRLLDNRRPELSFHGSASTVYFIQRSASVVGGTWVGVGSAMTDGSGVAVFEDVSADLVLPVFYRAVWTE